MVLYSIGLLNTENLRLSACGSMGKAKDKESAVASLILGHAHMCGTAPTI